MLDIRLIDKVKTIQVLNPAHGTSRAFTTITLRTLSDETVSMSIDTRTLAALFNALDAAVDNDTRNMWQRVHN